MILLKRDKGRSYNQMRPLHISYDMYGYAASSVLVTLGNTKVLCSITLQQGVPSFLKGKKTGWLTAEYAMLPIATALRVQRESSAAQRQGRSVEISRLIGRVIRSVVNLDHIGEQTIIIDCDVLQADGGTRAASITGASLALARASQHWQTAGIIKQPVLREAVAAVSVGIFGEHALLDLDFAEDSAIQADFTMILTQSGSIIELQGTAEKMPITWMQLQELFTLASQGVQNIFKIIEQSNSHDDEITVTSMKKNIITSSMQP